jgi:hypothetical protein
MQAVSGIGRPIAVNAHRPLTHVKDRAPPTLCCCARARSIEMLDIVMLTMGLGFFVLSIGYTYACDRL